MRGMLKHSAAALAAMAAAAAQGATLASLDDSGVQVTNTSVVLDFGSGAGAAQMSFALVGENTLDGDNFWIDVFTLRMDGNTALSGTWDLGGGGTDRVLEDAHGATVTRVDSRRVTVGLSFSLAAGPHVVSLDYASPLDFEGVTRAGFQGLGDEGWSVTQLVVTGVAPVPEPAPALLLATGLAALGWRARRA